MLYARRYAVSDRAAAERILDETLENMGRHLARDSRHVESVLVINLRTIWDSATAEEIAAIHDPDPPGTEEESSEGSRPGSQSEMPAPGATGGELRTIFGTSIPAEALEHRYHDDSLLTTVTSRVPFSTGESASTA